MKKLMVVLAIVLGFYGTSFAWVTGDTTNNYNYDITNQGGKGGDGGNAFAVGGGANVDVENRNTNINTNINSIKQSQEQGQGQIQGQKQGQGQGQFGYVNIEIENPREYLAVPGVGVYVPSLIPGQVLDVTKMIFLPVGLKAMAGNDTYEETITFNGWCMDRIRLEDLSQDILKYFRQLSGKWAESSQLRVQVWMKGQTKGWGGSGGGSGGMGAIQGAQATSGGAVGLLGYNTSYQDPQYVITFFRLSYGK